MQFINKLLNEKNETGSSRDSLLAFGFTYQELNNLAKAKDNERMMKRLKDENRHSSLRSKLHKFYRQQNLINQDDSEEKAFEQLKQDPRFLF